MKERRKQDEININHKNTKAATRLQQRGLLEDGDFRLSSLRLQSLTSIVDHKGQARRTCTSLCAFLPTMMGVLEAQVQHNLRIAGAVLRLVEGVLDVRL